MSPAQDLAGPESESRPGPRSEPGPGPGARSGPCQARGTAEHAAFCYHHDQQYVDGVRSFLRPALDAGEPVLVAVPAGRLEVLRAGLSETADLIAYQDLTIAGRNPGRIIPSILLPFTQAHPDQQVWVVGEPIWPLRSAEEYSACMVHEALVNLVFAGRPAVLLCAYDVSSLSPQVLRDVVRTHPILRRTMGKGISRAYADPRSTAAGFSPPLPAPPAHAAAITVVDERTLHPVRDLVARRAAAAGLPPDRVEEAVLAANELAANTVEHTPGPGRLTLWTQQQQLFCQMDDTGHISDPLAGRIPPPWDAVSGRGLLLMHELSDLVLIHSCPGQTTVRLQFLVPGPGPGAS